MAFGFGPYFEASEMQDVWGPMERAVKTVEQSRQVIVTQVRQDEKWASAFGFVFTSWQASHEKLTIAERVERGRGERRRASEGAWSGGWGWCFRTSEVLSESSLLTREGVHVGAKMLIM